MRDNGRLLRPGDPPWLDTAARERGVVEVPGEGHHSAILRYHQTTDLGATTDEVPWCSSFVNWVFEQHDITTTRSAAALSWLRWGRVLDEPVRGCLVVFERRRSDGTVVPHRGHVGFFLAAHPNGTTEVLGGNQRDSVRVSWLPTDRIIGYRWPSLPTNSTTNLASLAATAGTAVAAAPSVVDIAKAVSSDTEAVGEAVGGARTVFETLGVGPSGIAACVGLLVAVLGLIYIVRERNKKIRRWGI